MTREVLNIGGFVFLSIVLFVSVVTLRKTGTQDRLLFVEAFAKAVSSPSDENVMRMARMQRRVNFAWKIYTIVVVWSFETILIFANSAVKNQPSASGVNILDSSFEILAAVGLIVFVGIAIVACQDALKSKS